MGARRTGSLNACAAIGPCTLLTGSLEYGGACSAGIVVLVVAVVAAVFMFFLRDKFGCTILAVFTIRPSRTLHDIVHRWSA